MSEDRPGYADGRGGNAIRRPVRALAGGSVRGQFGSRDPAACFGVGLSEAIEHFIRTLKEQLLWVRSFRNAEELRLALLEWIELYNERWLIERHGHRSPAAVRSEHLALKASA